MIIRTAEILCVGTEILLGDIVNTNAAYLSRELASLGISQYRQSVIGDNSERLEETIKECLNNCDLLIMTGGLGPTYDDITKETAARAIGRGLYEDAEVLEHIHSYFKKRGRHMTDNNRKQANVIDGSTVLKNVCGTAPGTFCEADGKVLILLPGPPSEMMPMWQNEAKPLVAEYCDRVLVSRNINFIGIGESALAEKLGDMMEKATNPTIAPYCKTGEVRLRVTASADTREEALSMCLDTVEDIKATDVGKYIYGYDTTLEEAVVNTLRRKNKILSTAESCTGGLIAKMITDVPGASDVFFGGVNSYHNIIKNKVLGVSSRSLDKYGAVSHQVAVKMAEGVQALMNSDVSVAVTGIAGPGGGTEEKPVGLVYIAVCHNGKTTVKKYRFGHTLSREKIRELTAVNALTDVLEAIK